MLRHSRLAALIGLAGLAFVGGTASAQNATAEVHVRVEAGAGVPINGALVAVLDGDRVIAEGLSSIRGLVSLAAPSGSYRIRVRRIGFRPFVSEPISIPSQKEIVLRVETQRVVLDAMVVSAAAKCGAITRDAQTLSTVWEEVSKALRASQLTVEDLSGMGKMRTYRRELGTRGEVVSTQSTLMPITNARPFGALDPLSLSRLGYVRGDPQIGWEYFGPDEAVLLSDDFAATHCFNVVRDAKKRPGQIGVAFQPAPKRKVSDIKGVLWVDEKTAELRDVGFTYVNAGMLTAFEPGGFTKFRRVPSGAWIVNEWQLRMPKIALRYGPGNFVSKIGFVENGGIIVGNPTVTEGSRFATVTGMVWDSVAGTAISGATVAIADAVARTDGSGRFTFTGVPAGPRTISLAGNAVSALGYIAYEKELEVVPETTTVTLALPSFRTTWNRICADAIPEENHGILHGYVRNEQGEPIAGAQVKIKWVESREPLAGTDRQRLSLDVTTDSDGHYVGCGFRRIVNGDVSASIGNRVAEVRPFSFASGYLLRRDLVISSTASSGLAKNQREILVAVTDTSGSPVADVTVFVDGSTETARTDDQGMASLVTTQRDLAVGVRRIGYAQQLLVIKLGENQRQRLRVTLQPAQTLSTVNVVARAPMPAAIERRRDQGRGTFYGPEQISAANSLPALLSRVPGAKVEGTGLWALKFRDTHGGECLADVYLDGRLSAPYESGFRKFAELDTYTTDDVYAMEVYPRASELPPQFASVREGCGAIMVWTRGYAEAELARQERRAPVSAGDSTRKH